MFFTVTPPSQSVMFQLIAYDEILHTMILRVGITNPSPKGEIKGRCRGMLSTEVL